MLNQTRSQIPSVLLLAICVNVVFWMGTGSAVAQPANDLCTNAIEVFADSPVDGSNVNATGTDINSCAGSDDDLDVWYFYVAAENGLATMDMCDAASFDTTISIFSGCGGAELNCDDDACGDFRSTVGIGVDSGSTYYIRVAGYNSATGTFTLNVSLGGGGGGSGADVVYSDIEGCFNWGAVGGIRGYSWGTYTCNMGDANLPWNSTSPLVGFNAYRMENGRLIQIGMSWLKNATGAAAGNGCGLPCNGVGGSQLGAGCRDIYSSSFNGGQGILGPRSQCNAFNGSYPGPSGGSGNEIHKRLQIAETDITAALHPGALYFAEGVYVAAADAAAGNAMNNASHVRFTISGGFNIADDDSTMQIGIPALYAWRDHGLGLNIPDPSVQVIAVDVPDEGRFHVASKVTPLGDGTWRYDYAIFNLNSHRSAGLFSVPAPAGAVVTNVGFNDVRYHSGEPFDNTDWFGGKDDTSVTWKSPQTFAQNQNSNALRFGTTYNFWFDADIGPVPGSATIALFRPGTPETVAVAVPVPGMCAGDCFADGIRDALDIDAYVKCLIDGGKGCGCGDFSALGALSLADLEEFADATLSGEACP